MDLILRERKEKNGSVQNKILRRTRRMSDWNRIKNKDVCDRCSRRRALVERGDENCLELMSRKEEMNGV